MMGYEEQITLIRELNPCRHTQQVKLTVSGNIQRNIDRQIRIVFAIYIALQFVFQYPPA